MSRNAFPFQSVAVAHSTAEVRLESGGCVGPEGLASTLATFNIEPAAAFLSTLSVEPAATFYTAEVGFSPWLVQEGTTAGAGSGASAIKTCPKICFSHSRFIVQVQYIHM
jgi:hypothetical protein